jgi:hypothetical protein
MRMPDSRRCAARAGAGRNGCYCALPKGEGANANIGRVMQKRYSAAVRELRFCSI